MASPAAPLFRDPIHDGAFKLPLCITSRRLRQATPPPPSALSFVHTPGR